MVATGSVLTDPALEREAGVLERDLWRCCRDVLHGHRLVAPKLKELLDIDGWRRFARPIDGKIFTHANLEHFITSGADEGGLALKDWPELYGLVRVNAKLGESLIERLHMHYGGPPSQKAHGRALARDLRQAGDAEGGRPKKGVDSTPLPKGDSAARHIARLKRDRPDLAERVANGELSANAAAIEAGFRIRTITVPLDPEKAARVIRKHFGAADRQRLKEAL